MLYSVSHPEKAVHGASLQWGSKQQPHIVCMPTSVLDTGCQFEPICFSGSQFYLGHIKQQDSIGYSYPTMSE